MLQSKVNRVLTLKDFTLALDCYRKGKPINNLFNLLSSDELNYFRSIKSNQRKDEFLFSRSLIKKVLVERYNINPKNIQLSKGVLNQPILEGQEIAGNLDLSLSHSKGFVVVVFFNKKKLLGIDLEFYSNFTELITETFTNGEKEIGFNSHLKLMIWSAKESLGKAIKTGFHASFKSLEVENIKRLLENVYELKFVHFRTMCAYCFKLNSFIVSLSAPKIVLKSLDEVDIKKIYNYLNGY